MSIAIESVSAQLRKIIKTRGQFPTAEAAPKLLWLAIRNMTIKWGCATHYWIAAMQQFAILYEDRFTQTYRYADPQSQEKQADHDLFKLPEHKYSDTPQSFLKRGPERVRHAVLGPMTVLKEQAPPDAASERGTSIADTARTRHA